MKILLLGANGRLGQKIAQKFSENHIEFVSVERVHTSSFENFIEFMHSAVDSAHTSLLILDVSLPGVTHHIAEFLCKAAQPSLDSSFSSKTASMDKLIRGVIIGTTGHSPECRAALAQLSELVPVCIAPNFSKGIFLLGELLRTHLGSGKTLAAFAKILGFSVSLHDVHHQHKKDSPSGTALWLNQWLDIDQQSILSLRTGEVIGEHSVILKSENESIELIHKVTSRDVFAEGACDLSICFFKKTLSPGMYSLSDIWLSSSKDNESSKS